jgi:hypothetical protein
MSRLEIFCGQPRRRWSEEEKRRLVAEKAPVPGETVRMLGGARSWQRCRWGRGCRCWRWSGRRSTGCLGDVHVVGRVERERVQALHAGCLTFHHRQEVSRQAAGVAIEAHAEARRAGALEVGEEGDHPAGDPGGLALGEMLLAWKLWVEPAVPSALGSPTIW